MSKHSSWQEFSLGVRAQLPLQLGVVPFGMVFGVLGLAAGLTPLETVLMSSLVFGGASQVVFVQLWSAGAPPLIVGGSVAVVNARHLLYSAAMAPYLLTRPLASSLFGAAVCQVPLLDMKVYSKLLAGASWMGEYGNPDTDDWKFLRTFSAYHLLRHDCLGMPEDGQPRVKNAAWRCPKVLFTTSTRDDRVHPGHARKMVRALQEEATREVAPIVYYWENIEGGHGGAADNKQRAHMWGLTYAFLAQHLGLP